MTITGCLLLDARSQKREARDQKPVARDQQYYLINPFGMSFVKEQAYL